MKEVRKVVQAYDQWRRLENEMALATVVKVEESSYRRIGARMLVSASGLFVGGISGGCLEGDALKKAQFAIHKKVASKVVYDTLEEDDYQIGIGLGCNGRIEILFTPIDINAPDNPVELLRKTIEADRAAIMLKIIDSPDATLLGHNALLIDQVELFDFANIPAGALSKAIETTLEHRRPKVFMFKNKEGQNVEVLAEYLRPETRLILFGNNYDVNAMIGVAGELGWQVSVVGKKGKIQKSISHSVKTIYDYAEVENIPLDDYTAVVLMTHDYAWDLKMLPYFLDKKEVPYVGILGPRKRFDKLSNELLDNGTISNSLHSFTHLHAPVGLDIGSESPEEISLSIAAEILSVFRGREGQKLKLRVGTIHEREGE